MRLTVKYTLKNEVYLTTGVYGITTCTSQPLGKLRHTKNITSQKYTSQSTLQTFPTLFDVRQFGIPGVGEWNNGISIHGMKTHYEEADAIPAGRDPQTGFTFP